VSDFPDFSAAKSAQIRNLKHLEKYDALAAEEIISLAGLAPGDYDRQRKQTALRLGIRLNTLDMEVNATRKMLSQDDDFPSFSDDELALRFSDKHADFLRFTAKFGKWHEWRGSHWKLDEKMNVFSLCRKVCRDAANEAAPAAAEKIKSKTTVAAVEWLARSDTRHAATTEQWDNNPWIMATPGGTINLRTGAVRPAKPDDHCTKVTAVSAAGDCPQWRIFLDRVTDKDSDLQAFLQRVIGYCLTGTTSEHALFFCYGTGGNGKGVFLNTISAILADYASVASMDTFTASQSDRHPADLAMLRGARLVAAQETEEGRAWAESRVKAMTGGDPITARFMRQDFFTYQPQFKLVIAGNHKPSLRNVDPAMRRRFNLIPFTVTIPEDERDPDLPEKLKAEWSGILQWAVDGCIAWQEIGLKAPASVLAATEEYLSGEDSLSLWISERCLTGQKSYEAKSSALFKDYQAWMLTSGEKPVSQKSFSQALETKGFIKDNTLRHTTFSGIRLDDVQPSHFETPDERY
jgi:putative DNA primase/helicase